MDHGAMGHAPSTAMPAAFGNYPMTREASGTSWQPDSASHSGVHWMAGQWMGMTHAMFTGVYDEQSGPRGGTKSFLAGMVMASAQRELGGGTFTLRGMLSPDPFMGKRGYPLLLAGGETADGQTPLVDRQHPHELVMELSASYAHAIGGDASWFVYAGLPGEPAFGPPAFMHRQSAMDFPIAPITHHWLDSTHVTFGVATAGFVWKALKLDASAFRGREPDQDRFDIESPRLDSAAVRASWNPSPNLALQTSWADVTSPEQLHPDDDETRKSVSATYTQTLGATGSISATLAWGRKNHGGENHDGYLIEAALRPDDAWTFFTRAEQIDSAELVPATERTVRKVSLGALHDWKVAQHARLGLGALYSFDHTPGALAPAYGDKPHGVMAFVRLKMD